MSKKTRRRGLLEPRRPKKFREFYGAPWAVGVNVASVLDATEQELHPLARPAPLDQPKKRPEFLLSKSDVFQHLTALIDAAMAWSGVLNSDDDQPELAMCEAAGLTRAEYEVIILRADGLDFEEVARRQHVRLRLAQAAAITAMNKLDRFVRVGLCVDSPHTTEPDRCP